MVPPDIHGFVCILKFPLSRSLGANVLKAGCACKFKSLNLLLSQILVVANILAYQGIEAAVGNLTEAHVGGLLIAWLTE